MRRPKSPHGLLVLSTLAQPVLLRRELSSKEFHLNSRYILGPVRCVFSLFACREGN
jgi:hypothetical protein